MGMIGNILGVIFGGGRNVLKETAEVFRPNAEAAAIRDAAREAAALAQFAAEFGHPRKGLFDRLIDGLNRLPRPMLALGTIGLFISAMVDPVWFATWMQGLALVPEPLWWLMGAIVSFYFGARHQTKSQEFQRSLATTLARTPEVARNIETLAELGDAGATDEDDGEVRNAAPDGVGASGSYAPNAALDDWRRSRGQ